MSRGVALRRGTIQILSETNYNFHFWLRTTTSIRYSAAIAGDSARTMPRIPSPLRLARLSLLLICAVRTPAQTLLHPADYRHYIQTFEADEQLATGKVYNGEPSASGQAPEPAWPWMT